MVITAAEPIAHPEPIAPPASAPTILPRPTPARRLAGSRRTVPALTRKLLRDVMRMRGQVLSIAAVVACGVMMAVSMYGTLRSVHDAVDDYYARYRFGDVFASATRAPVPIMRKLAEIPGVVAVEPRTTLVVSLDVAGLPLPAGGRLISVRDDGVRPLNGVHLRAGRMVRPKSADEVVVSSGFADANRIGIGDSVGAVLEGRWKRLRVVGIGMSPEFVWELSAAGSFTVDDRAFAVLWMSRTAVDGAAGMRGAFNDVVLTLANGANVAAVKSAVDTVLAPYGGTGAVGRDRQRSHAIVEGEFRSLGVFGITFPVIFLLVAIFLINAVLARLVATQRGEIAALKAFGYTNGEIGLHYLEFATVAAIVGTGAGIALGAWIGGMYTGLYESTLRLPALHFSPDAGSTAVAAVASLAAAIGGAMFAVRGAVRLPPAEALRPESPERYRPLLLERLGLGDLVPTAARMVLRHLERRPTRAASTVVGVALALGLLAGTMTLFDAAFYMADVQFRSAQREDLSVTFSHARPLGVRRELARLPGVLAVETFRAVPVRVRHRSVVRTVAIMALERDATLHRVADGDDAIFRIPPRGALLTAAFARLLGVATGDTLRLELIEHGGTMRPVEVIGLVDELFGSNIYMEQQALARLLQEEPRANGAFLRIDRSAEREIMKRLKTMPAVTGAASREALIASWDRQMIQNIRVSGTLVVACAIVIALGAVYNGARIGLSERGREFASLRVLGFRRREVAALLFGEQAMLTLLALPVGVGLGVALTHLVARGFVAEEQRFPVVMEARTYAGAVIVIVLAAIGAGLLMRRRLERMDLVAVLKTRE